MMNLKSFVAGVQLTTAAKNYYQAPEKTRAAINKLTLTNTSGGAVLATVYIVPAGGSAAASNTLIYQQSIDSLAIWDCFEAASQVLEPGMSLQMLASVGASLTVFCSGVEAS